jgi:hypothetical protein
MKLNQCAWGQGDALFHFPPDTSKAALARAIREILTLQQLSYSPRTESGSLFYMLGGVAEVGCVGMVAIGNSRAEAAFSSGRSRPSRPGESGPRTQGPKIVENQRA